MIENIKRVDNPLTIIGAFAIIAEISMTVALAAVGPELRAIFIWFVMLFPVLLVLLFFVTLNFNHKVLYAPSDFKDDSSFMELATTKTAQESLEKAEGKLEVIQKQLNETKSGDSTKITESLKGALQEVSDNVVEAMESLQNIEFDDSTYPGMTWGQWRLLAFLNTVNDVSAQVISTALNVKPAEVRYNLHKLELNHLVESRRSVDDPRINTYRLTALGKTWTAMEIEKYKKTILGSPMDGAKIKGSPV